jgi:hypothetical protein
MSSFRGSMENGACVSIDLPGSPPRPGGSPPSQGKTKYISERYEMKSTKFQTVAPGAAIDKREFLGEVEGILRLDPNILRGPEVLGSHGWDSIAVITFQAFLDERLGVTIDCGRIAACNTFDDLFQLTVNCENHEPAESNI